MIIIHSLTNKKHWTKLSIYTQPLAFSGNEESILILIIKKWLWYCTFFIIIYIFSVEVKITKESLNKYILAMYIYVYIFNIFIYKLEMNVNTFYNTTKLFFQRGPVTEKINWDTICSISQEDMRMRSTTTRNHCYLEGHFV